MSDQITDTKALEACIGTTPGPVQLKVIDHLDQALLHGLPRRHWRSLPSAMARSWRSRSAAGRRGSPRPRHAAARFAPRVVGRHQLRQGVQGFGLLFLATGIGETLRVNGRVTRVTPETIDVEVDECYIHCAKALIRSEFWAAKPRDECPGDPAAFLTASRFMSLATMDSQGRVDVSPKGDPQGSMIRLADDAAWFADRPGNRRADSFRNILSQPRVGWRRFCPASRELPWSPALRVSPPISRASRIRRVRQDTAVSHARGAATDRTVR